MEMTGGLQEAIDELHRAFETYPRPKWFMGCECCWDEGKPIPDGKFQRGMVRIEAPGDDRPLRELTVAELKSVADLVPHLGGDIDIFRHYLPRMFEILVTTGFDWPDFEPVIKRLNYGADLGGEPWWTWPAAEQTAINNFLSTAWRERLAQPVEDSYEDLSVDGLLCGIGTVVEDIRPYLATWLAFEEPYAARHLEFFLDRNPKLSRGRLTNGFWGPDNSRAAGNIRCVVRWTHAQNTLAAVTATHETVISDDERVALEQCFDWLTGNDAFGSGHLEQAVEANDATRVAELLAAGVDLNETESLTATPIWQIALETRKFAIAAVFARAGADLDRVDKRHQSLLHRLVSQGADIELIKHALKIGASIHSQDRYGWTALHAACAYGHANVVKVLLAAGADPSATTKDGKRPIDFATANNHHTIPKLLRTGPRSREQ